MEKPSTFELVGIEPHEIPQETMRLIDLVVRAAARLPYKVGVLKVEATDRFDNGEVDVISIEVADGAYHFCFEVRPNVRLTGAIALQTFKGGYSRESGYDGDIVEIAAFRASEVNKAVQKLFEVMAADQITNVLGDIAEEEAEKEARAFMAGQVS